MKFFGPRTDGTIYLHVKETQHTWIFEPQSSLRATAFYRKPRPIFFFTTEVFQM